MSRLAMLSQDSPEAGLAREVHAFISQHRHDARRRHISETRLVGNTKQSFAFLRAQGVSRHRTHRRWPLVASLEAIASSPALQRSQIDASDLTSQAQPRAI